MLSQAPHGRPLNIAHRGARSIAPENTLAAARKALAAGADMWELDISMTADRELLVLHDDTLARTSNARDIFPERRPWKVSDFILDEIRRLDFGSWYSDEDPFGEIASGMVRADDLQGFEGEPAPTLEEALVFSRENGLRVNVEIKDLKGAPGDGEIVERVVELIERLGMIEWVVVSSFNHEYLKRARLLSEDLPIGILTDSYFRKPLSLLRKLKAWSYHPRKTSIRLKSISRLVGSGFRVFVWTVNDESAMIELVRAGVSGIITDYPQKLSSLLERIQSV